MMGVCCLKLGVALQSGQTGSNKGQSLLGHVGRATIHTLI